jgi:hypothetical protein
MSCIHRRLYLPEGGEQDLPEERAVRDGTKSNPDGGEFPSIGLPFNCPQLSLCRKTPQEGEKVVEIEGLIVP